MSIYDEIENAMHAKHKGHKLGRVYQVDAERDLSIRICETCDIAVLFIKE